MPLRGLRSGVLYAAAVAALGTAVWLFVTRGRFDLVRLAASNVALHLDFDTFQRSGRALLAGQDVYAGAGAYPNLNPPIDAVLFVPFADLGVLPGYRLLGLVTVVLVVGGMALVARELRIGPAAAVGAAAAVLVSSPFLATVGLGQTYGLLTAGLTGAWLARRRRRPVIEAVALGATIALKPSLAPLLLLPFAARRWWSGVGTLAVALVVTVAGALAAGHGALATWVGLLTAKPLETYFDNASLVATTVRVLADGRWGHPVLTLPPEVAVAIGVVAAAVVVGLTLWRIVRAPSADGAQWALAAAALLASPLTWNNYLVVLVPGVLLLIARRRWAAVCAALALPLVGPEWLSLWVQTDEPTAVPLSLYCATLLLYWLLFLGETRREPSGDQPAVDVGPDGSSR